ARQQFVAEGRQFEREPVSVIEVTVWNQGDPAPLDNAELISRIEQLAPQGAVVVTNYAEGYAVIDYLRKHTAEPIRFVLAVAAFLRIMEGRVYTASPGAVLEIFGRLLATDVTIYVAPMRMEPFVAALGGLPEGFVQESAASEFMTLDDFIPK